jgi:hypothetical protein
MVVGAVVTSAACGTVSIGGTTWPDLGCWLQQVWNSIVALGQIPGQIVEGIYNLFYVSKSGKSYIDFAVLGNALIPGVACRSGQSVNHPDGVHCLPFPFSIANDVLQVVSIADVAPTSPVLTAHLHVPPVDETFSIDPTVVLTATLMGYVRGVELVLFVVALGAGTYRIVQALDVN